MAKPGVFSRSRIMKGLTQRELAKQCKLSHAYVSLLERSVKSVGPAAAKRLSEVLDMPMEELFTIE
ncbi:helix-turn-helix transcriptional regulator [Paenibacillus aurantius]|uniref:Helix-turn-helix transcriptional regulator n=1 Tax=Paenibacillus aurantius TaxID=2918900 RepID=A0AA96LI75_9BACL|nr:helix-turn-helix transcriptional regulator [Paenibacillus aurantius]WNQ14286.1 helix-turn-helix transcriptional regulator [Paenibacillus aurantius]